MTSSEGVQIVDPTLLTGEIGEGIAEASFEEYELFCNHGNTSSRKAGILDPEMYVSALQDPRTIRVEIEGKLMPAAIDIEMGLSMGYEVARAKQYASDQPRISVLSLPITGVSEKASTDILEALKDYNGALYFSDHNGEDGQKLGIGLQERGRNVEERPLLDTNVKNPQAALSLYACDAINTTPKASSEPVTLADIQRVFDEKKRPFIKDPDNAVFIENGANLTEPQLSQIWELYTDRFQFLGENHPISLEDDEASFRYVIAQPNTTVSFKTENGKIVCLSDFTQGFENIYWLNQDFLQNQASNHDPSVATLFFPGIVASPEAHGSSRYVLGLFAEVAGEAGMSARIIFENTNISEEYVPNIVYRVVSSTGTYNVEPPQKLDEVKYRLALLS